MKKVKNYIEAELAKKKIARYKYWSIKDENGITIVSSEDEAEGRNFGEMLDKIIKDNVDAEVQIKYGTNEQSSRHNLPFFIQVNETIEWVDPEEETVQINGVAHKLDKNGNVNINLTSPNQEEAKTETVQIDTFRQELEMQLQGIRREHELKEERWQMDMHNKLLEQNIKFKEMLLAERETRCKEREENLAVQEAQLNEKEKEISEDVKGYVKQIPNALGGVLKEWIKSGAKEKPLSGTEKESTKPKKRSKANFTIEASKAEENEGLVEVVEDENLEIETEEEFYGLEAEEDQLEQTGNTTTAFITSESSKANTNNQNTIEDE